jgi:2-polyprenyl-3-methyl-5-hydroxy-6-metoxy-1,4-benzoquinol methylase
MHVAMNAKGRHSLDELLSAAQRSVYPFLQAAKSTATSSEPLRRLSKMILTGLWSVQRPLTKAAGTFYRLGTALEMAKDWSVPPTPEWFNHELDIAFFPQWRKPHFFERGVYASEVAVGKRVLDLCCGDGAVAALFVARVAEEVLAVDFDRNAIAHATKRWRDIRNVRYDVMDIRSLNVPAGYFDTVLWDAAIEHFTQAEMDAIMASIKRALKPDGLLHGSTIKRGDSKQHDDHEYEFESLRELQSFLQSRFKHVVVFERVHQDRIAFYFRCCDVTPSVDNRAWA